MYIRPDEISDTFDDVVEMTHPNSFDVSLIRLRGEEVFALPQALDDDPKGYEVITKKAGRIRMDPKEEGGRIYYFPNA